LSYDNLKSGKSTGCQQCGADKNKLYHTKIEQALQKRASAAQARCTNPNDAGYADYGGRGIEFRFESIPAYVRHCLALPGVDINKEIDRIDNNGHYEVGNLRWADRVTQSKNKRTNRRVVFRGEEMVFSDFVRDHTYLSVSRAKIYLDRGLSLEEISEIRPQLRGRRSQGVRLGKLRADASVHGRQLDSA
jgi:hypothetical protein